MMNKKIILGLVVAVILILILGEVWQHQASPQSTTPASRQEAARPEAAPEAIKKPEPETSPQSAEDNGAAGWKTYRDTKHLYSFKVPDDWKVYPSKQHDEVSVNSPHSERLQELSLKEPGYTPSELDIKWYKNLKSLADNLHGNTISSLEEFINKDLEISQYTSINFDEGKALAFDMGGYSNSYCIIYNKHNSIYWIKFNNVDSTSLSPTHNQIISSFHFD